MILSGWQIYNASPILPFLFPRWMTLGGWLAGAIAWHITAMWVLMADGLLYVVWGLASGHFARDFLPLSPAAVLRDLKAAFAFSLPHRLGRYNAVQRLLYIGVTVAAVLAVLTGLSIWKPVQLGWLTWVFGGYDIARRIHFTLMTAIVAFLLVHVTLVAIVPSTLRAMITGGPRVESDDVVTEGAP
jgi:thiosulfate reductase cytochrome b subunit